MVEILMNTQELQYILQIMAAAEIKGNHALAHATIMQKLTQWIEKSKQPPDEVKEDASGDL